MKHLPTSEFLRDLARRVNGDYDRSRLENIANVVDGMDGQARSQLDPAPGPAPGSTMGLAGATITHRPDLAYNESARQAAGQGESGYLPVQRAMGVAELASAGVPAGAGGTIQQPAPPHAAETAKIGAAVR